MAFLTVLSLLVSFAVPFSLIMPAISMTNENGTEQGYFDTNQIANNINYVSNPPSGYSGALDISSADEFSVGAFNGKFPLDYEIQEDKINVRFEFNFEFAVSGENVYANSLLNSQNFMYLNISDVVTNTKFILAEKDKTGNMIDTVYSTNQKAGTYEITDDGYIIVKLEDDYITYLEKSKILGGGLEFSGELSRKDDEDGDQKFQFGKEEVTVEFKDKYPTISKNGWETNPNDGTITWEITVNNSAKSDLSQYTLEDIMKIDEKEISFSPSDIKISSNGTEMNGTFSDGKFTIPGEFKNNQEIKITYKTPISAYGKNVKNEAHLKKDNYDDTSPKDVWIDKAIEVTKKGTPDYEKNSETYNKQINWTIEITPKHGQSLDGYEIVDANFPSDLSKIAVSPAGSLTTKDGKTVLTGTTKGQKTTLKYTANAEVGKDNKNNVTVTPPGGTPEPGEDTVHYKDKSDFYNLTKDGSYDQDTHLVKWTIKVSSTDNTSLNGYKLVDAGFENAVDGKFYINGTENAFTSKELNGSTMTLTGDSTNVEFYYYTKVTKEEASKKEVSNDVELKDPKDDPLKDPDPTKVIVSEFRDTLYKSVRNHGDSNVDSTGTIQQDIEWSVNITYDDSLAGKTYTDTLSVTGGNGANHTITQEQLNAMDVWAGEREGNKEKLTLGTDYYVSLKGSVFTVTFKDTDKVKNSNYVDLTYKTTATAGSDFTTYEFKNSGSGFGDGTNNSGSHSITRGNPNIDNKTNIHITKNWNDNNNEANERPNTIKVRVMYQTKTGINGQLTEWKPLKGSGENYLFDSDAGYAGASEYTITLTGSNWTADLNNLPMEKAVADTNGNKQDSTYYYYKIEEIEQNGTTITGGYFNTANGLYQVANSNSSNQSNPNQYLDVTNTYYGNIDITAKKNWSDDTGFESNRKDVTVELWRSTNQYDWSNKEVIGTQTLNSTNNWSYIWQKLKSAGVVNNSTVNYYYKIVETKVGGVAVSNGTIIKTNNGYYEVTSSESSVSNITQTLEVKNTFKKNVTIIPKKAWAGDALDGDITEIVVKLQRRIVNGTWENVPDASNITLTADKLWTPTQDDYSTWTNLPRKDDNNKDYYYRVVEVSAKTSTGSTIILEDTDKTFITDKGYYEISDSGDSNNAVYWGDSQTLTVTNTFHKTESLTINAKKIWNDKDINGVNYSIQRPDLIILQLQRYENGTWEKFSDEKTLSNEDNQICSWNEGLFSQMIDPDTKEVTKYKYRVLEVGYVHNGTTYRLPEGNTVTFATTDDGTYEGTYKVNQNTGGNELEKSGTVTITNTFEPLKTIEITPQKKWSGDSQFLSNRPQSIKFRLQYKNGDKWEDYEDASGNIVEVDLTSNPDTDQSESNWENGQQVVSTIWQGQTVSNLPQKKISCIETTDDKGNTITTYKTELCSYRFVEVVDGNILEDDSSFKVSNGRYEVTLGNEINYTGDFLITNTFKESIGVIKTAIDSNGQPMKSIDKEDLYDKEVKDKDGNVIDVIKSPYRKTIDGVDYYVFNYLIELESTKTELVTPILDILPEGFTLVEEKPDFNISETNIKWGGEVYLTTPFGTANVYTNPENYYYNPCIIWQSGTGPATGANYIKRVSQIYDKSTSDGQASKGAWDNVRKSPARYYYDKNENKIYFGIPDISQVPVYTYSAKIRCEDLDSKLENGSYVVVNKVEMYDNDGTTPTGRTDEASLTIVNKVPSNLITKDYVGPSLAPGYINFALDINPDGKNLSNGDTIDIEDIFRTDSYFDSDWSESKKIAPELATGTNLVDVLMNSIKIYKVDVNENKIELSANDYQLQFDSSADGVNSKEGEQGAALLKLTIPDETHIRIEYEYKLIANTKTPSVINGCLSSTKAKKGKGYYYPQMAPGLVPPSEDIITFTNKANLYSDSASADDSVKNQEYEVSDSKGTIYANKLPKVKKVNTGNVEIANLQAKFLLAKYDQSSQKWLYATKIAKGEKITEWSEGVTGLNVAEGAVKIDVDTGYSDEVSLEQDALYKLIEVEVPEGYEGSNLGLNQKEFEEMIVDYLNGDTTNTNVILYETFLSNFVNTHYFVYNSVITSYPEGVDKNSVIQVKNGDDVQIPNNELINLGVKKNWINNEESNKDSKIDVRLYWSYTKASVGMPSDAKEVKADELGIMDENFSSTKTVKSGTTENVWTDLPNGKNGKPIYYYIKETAYEIAGTKYTLIEDKENANYGKYMSEEGTEGMYMPTYVGNAANSDTSITVNNSQQLMLKKIWKTSSNNPLSESKIPTDEIIVSIYGIDKLGAKKEEPIFENVVLTKEGNWQLDITGLLTPEIDLSQYKSFEVKESGFNTDDYVISCVFNLNENTGEITVTNKNINATEASVSVNKVWSDGADLHKNESIKVTLYQSETEIKDVSKLTLQQLTSAGAKIMTSTNPEDTQIYKDVELNAENEWSYSWTGLPIDDGSEVNPKTYYYYVLEDMSGIANADKYVASYSSVKSNNNTKTEYTINNKRNSIVVQKEWFDEDGNVIVNYNEDGKLVDDEGNILAENSDMYSNLEAEFNVYKRGSLKIHAFGDSITFGSLCESGKSFASGDSDSYLASELKELGFNKGINVCNDGSNGWTIQQASGKSAHSDDDIYTLLIGTNDIINCDNIDGMQERLKEAIKKIYATGSNDKTKPMFVASIPDFNHTDAKFGNQQNLVKGEGWFASYKGHATSNLNDQQIEDYANNLVKNYNDGIPATLEALKIEGYNVYFVDANSVVSKKTGLYDGCHTSTEGSKAIAKAFAKAIDDNYTPPKDKIITSFTLNKANNWTDSVDIPQNENNKDSYYEDSYYVREVTKTGWKVKYIDNNQQVASGNTITVENHKVSERTSITLEKTWVGDSPNDSARDGVKFMLLRSTTPDVEDSWEQYVVKTPEPTKTDDKWTYVFGVDAEGKPTLPTKDINGDTYYYKFEEYELDGYNATYDDNKSQGLISVNGGSAGIFYITNTRQIALKIQKQWSDSDTNEHLMDTVKVQIFRSTDPNDIPDVIKNNLMLQVPASVSVGVDKSLEVVVNKTIESAVSDNEIVTVKVEGNKLVITGGSKEGNAKITVSDGIEEKVINVTVSSLEILLNNDRNYTITAGDEVTLSATKDGATFNVVSENDVVDISGDKLTAKNVGTAVISATANGVTVEQTITVDLPETFIIDGPDEVAIDSSIKLSKADSYGTIISWESLNPDIATVDNNGNVTGVSAGIAKIKATRDGGTSVIKEITVKEKSVTLSNEELTKYTASNPLKFDKSISSITFTFVGPAWAEINPIYFGDNNHKVKLGFYATDSSLICVEESNSSLEGIEFGEGMVTGESSWGAKYPAGKNGVITFKFNTPINQIYFSGVNNISSLTYDIKYAPVNRLFAPNNTMTLMSDGEPVKLTGELVEEIEIKQSDGWTKTVTNLDVYDSNKQPYYYWAVETDTITGYTATYLFTDSDDETNNCLNASQLGDGEIVIKNNKTVSEGVEMPSTGGEGTKGIKETGMFIMLGSAVSYIVIRRLSRKKRIR